MDYVLNIYEDEKFIVALGAKHICYDNVIYWQIEELIKVVREYKNNKKEMIKKIQKNAPYFKCVLNEVQENEASIDIGKEIIDMPYVPLFNIDEISLEDVPFELIKKDNKYFAKYDDDEYEMTYVEFDEELLRKEKVTFDEFLKISDFITYLLGCDNDSDFILNNSLVLRLNLA